MADTGDVKEIIQIDADTRDLTADAVTYITAICEQKRALDAVEKRLKDKLLGVMSVAGVFRLESDQLVVSLVTPETKPREVVNIEKMREDFPEIVAAYTELQPAEARAPYVKITIRR